MSRKRNKSRKPNKGRGALHRVLARPEDGRRYAAEGAAALAARRWAVAVEQYENALACDPSDSELLAPLARAHGMLYDFDATARVLERLVRRDPKSARRHIEAGRTWDWLGKLPEAAEHFRRAVELSPDSAEARVLLARLLERMHRLEEARAMVNDALRIEADAADALLMQARLDRRAGELDLAATRLRDLLGRDSVGSEMRIEAGHDLAAVLDGLGDYDAAMDALLAAKKIRAQHASEAVSRWRTIAAATRRLFAALTAEHLKRWSDAAPSWTPLRLTTLAGHPRSGTTLLEQVLDSHPGLISAEEVPVATDALADALLATRPPGTPTIDVLDEASVEQIAERRADYMARMEAFLHEPIGNRVLMDKNPELTWMLPFLVRVFPEMKTLIAIRDPRDVCLSCFMQSMAVTPVSSNWLSLERTVNRYAFVMGCWLRMREIMRSPWMEVRYEDTVQDLEGQTRRILEFLGLPWDAGVLDYRDHAKQRHVTTPSYEAVTRPVHRGAIGRWQNYARHLEPYLEVLEPFVREFGYA